MDACHQPKFVAKREMGLIQAKIAFSKVSIRAILARTSANAWAACERRPYQPPGPVGVAFLIHCEVVGRGHGATELQPCPAPEASGYLSLRVRRQLNERGWRVGRDELAKE